MGNRASNESDSDEVLDAEAAEEAAILADSSLSDGEKAARMHVLEPKDRGRRWEDFFELPEDSLLGRGHYGEVRRVVRIADRQTFAMKTIEKRRPIYIDILKSEVKILSNTDHPGIVKMVDKFELGKHLYLVFETCHGGELFEPIADSATNLSERQSARIIRKVLEAVRYLHDNGIVHRDLKPENILLKDRGIDSELKVIDFGLATYIKPGEMLRRHVGTPYYIAPEVLNKSYGFSADVWSLGVILYTLLCSAPPFFGDTEREIYNRIKTGNVMFDGPEWSTRSLLCRELVTNMLRRDISARFSIDDALAYPWVVYEGDVSMDPSDPRTFARLFARLRRYGVFPVLKKLTMLHVATKLLERPQRTERERVFFRCIDEDCDGAISASDLAAFLAKREAELKEEEVQWIIEGLSMREGEQAPALLPELTAAIMPRLNYLREGSLLHEFAFFDTDSDGVISVHDLATAAGIDYDTADAAIAEAHLGQDSDGVDFGTFVRVLAGGERDAI